MITIIEIVVAFLIGVAFALRAKSEVLRVLTVIHSDVTTRLDAIEAKLKTEVK